MEFKDIVNREVVNLTNCEHEPIHIPGSIQPHGFLLGVKADNFLIDYCSANSFDHTGIRFEQLLGKRLDLIFDASQCNEILSYLDQKNKNSMRPLQMELADKKFTCTATENNGIYILDFEPLTEDSIGISDIYHQMKQFTVYMQNSGTLQKLCQSIADETRSITGYDRVMIYRFDEDYNGEVFAESKTETVEPFLGLHYPHTDIPVQARELYFKNLLRIIVDVNYQPVPLYTIDEGVDKNINLSLSTLRSVSPIHIQYLQNMGVAATLTISLIHEGRLWGLIACHNYSPKYLINSARIAAQLQGHFLTSQISVRELAEEYEVAKKVNKSLEDSISNLFADDHITIDKIIGHSSILSITNADGIIICIDDKLSLKGKVPTEIEINKLINWLQVHDSPIGFNTSNLSKLYPDAENWCDCTAGIIFHSLGRHSNNCIMWCRAQTLEEVKWGGDPQKAIIKDEKGLFPRKSFELWKEVKKCESAKWQKPELMAAANFANALQKQVHVMFLTREELKHRKLSEKLKDANAELENINWIGNHDLKEPLRKIQLFASRILDRKDEGVSDQITKSVAKMNESAKRMQILIADILSYSRLNNSDWAFEVVDLNNLVNTIIHELNADIAKRNGMIYLGNLPAIKGVPFLIQQLFINLIRNALKFSKDNIALSIDIRFHGEVDFSPAEYQITGRFYKIVVQDNGIGFDNQHKESIFKVFTRLHFNTEYSGSGVGLALCKKIMQNHNGYILAEGEVGIGASFYLYFPIT